ncbi:MAG: DegT/DnrJ/EryC1/StrS family aminotransferase [Candidatus Aenigmarchaeota archaeon]|nr:DegT/DnrJ/EryC1/StrS family aminotransferase [Candidatus Aenigmarchaeota archaeon]
MKIPITKPYFTEDELIEIKDTLESGWVVQGPKVRKFEEMFAEYVGVKYAVATSSCTTALHLCLKAIGVSLGHDVLVPSFTFVATPNSVEYTGANVVFVDIDLDTYNMSVEDVEKIIDEKYEWDGEKLVNKETGNILKALMPVHQFGLPADIISLNKIARKYNLRIVEDGACAVGARINGKHVGSFGNLCAFSFHPRKSITTGEGGMIVTDNKEIAELVSIMRSHGGSVSDFQRHQSYGFLLPEYNILGYNYRMTDIQGAIGIHQMRKLEHILNKKNEIVKIYRDELNNLEGIVLPYVPKGYTHGYQSFVCRIDNDILGLSVEEAHEIRYELMKNLEEAGISTRQGTHASHMLGYYKRKYGYHAEDLKNSYKADRLSIALPLYYSMEEHEISYVVEKFKFYWKEILERRG